jgi:pyruvate kinase
MDSPLYLKRGDKIHFTTQAKGSKREIPLSYKKLPSEIEVGGNLYIADGLIEVKITSIDESLRGFSAKVYSGGEITSGKGVNAPDASLSMKPPTKRDSEGIEFGVTEGIDWFAVSFVRTPLEVEMIRTVIKEAGGSQPIISKIEHREAVANIEEIINVSDAIMVARGDLGIEVNPWEVPLIQKSIIDICGNAGKPVIVATQMLESMVTNPRPTRAEASDVANAILDGADAVMLSEETAIGLFPVEAVRVMNNISHMIESGRPHKQIHQLGSQPAIADIIGSLASQAAEYLTPAAILVVTRSGFSALMISKHRPRSRILALTRDVSTRRRMQLYWGVEPLDITWTENRDKLLVRAIEKGLETELFSLKDNVMVVSGSTLEAPGRTTALEILQVDEVLKNKNKKENKLEV